MAIKVDYYTKLPVSTIQSTAVLDSTQTAALDGLGRLIACHRHLTIKWHYSVSAMAADASTPWPSHLPLIP